MVAQVTTKNGFAEIGSSGLVQYSGIIQEEFLRDLTGLRWRRIVKEMSSNDPVVAAMFFAIEMLTRQVTWDVQSAADDNVANEGADFVRGCLDDMSTSWKDTLAEILSFLPWGWSYHEQVYKQRTGESNDPSKRSKFNDGRIGWRKWPLRSQDSLDRWDFDENGGVQAMVQNAPPKYQTVSIPIDKALLFRTSSHKNNPEGRSLLRSCYRPWFFKTRIENFEGIGIERDLAGLPIMRIPADYLAIDADANKAAIAAMCREIVTSVRANEQGGVLIPSDPFPDTSVPMFVFELVSTGSRRQFDTNQIITRKNQEILMTLMADFLMLGQQQVGSFALSSDKTGLFATALGTFLDSICEVINRHAIPRLTRLNAFPPEANPTLTHGDIESVDLGELGQFIANLSGARVSLTPEQLAYIEKQAGLPVPDNPEELAAMIGSNAPALPFGPPPPQEPK
jgi:hypothetical protein